MTMKKLPESKAHDRGRRATRRRELHKVCERSEATLRGVAAPVTEHSRGATPRSPFPSWVVLAARVAGPSLDERLAEGASPESSDLLSARAHVVAAPAMRRSLAESYLDLLAQAYQTPRMLDLRVPVVRRAVVASEALIRDVADALCAPVVNVRGVAHARALLSDGAGPLYFVASAKQLAAVLREILVELDPLSSAITPAGR